MLKIMAGPYFLKIWLYLIRRGLKKYPSFTRTIKLWLYLEHKSKVAINRNVLFEAGMRWVRCLAYEIWGDVHSHGHVSLAWPWCCFVLPSCCSLFSHPIVSNSSLPHGLQHARPPCPLPSPVVFLSSYPLYWWCHPAISSSDTLFSFCPQSFSASGTFPMIWLFMSDDQNTGASASKSVLPMSVFRVDFP